MKTLKNILLLLFTVILITNVVVAQTNSENARVIYIKGTDNMKFDVTSIEAKPGELIKIVFTVESRIPKQAMAHNVVLLKSGVDVKAYVNASAKARDNQYLAPELSEQVIAASDLAGGGETVEMLFIVPETRGDYEYVCSFPGHFYGGMKGVLTVK